MKDTEASSRIVLLARDIKISHSIFALPFALLASYLAAAQRGEPLCGDELGLIVMCMVLARTVAMTMNRWADRFIDQKNPRTALRAIPSGQLTAKFVLNTAVVCSLLFMAATSGFYFMNGNAWPLILSPIVLVWLAGYSFTKRFTWMCHLVLGSALAISPLAAAIAIYPPYLGYKAPYLLAMMVMCWVAGFDVIYALQDVNSDREKDIYSMPAKLGVNRALWISRTLHVSAVAALAVLIMAGPPLGLGFTIGVGIIVLLLILEHALVWHSHTHHIHMAFFTLNGIISLLLGGLGIIDVLHGA
jgi:4-hydroxybenzoate polyprenyltransferase